MKNKWYDITIPLKSGMVHWPGDPDIDIYKIGSISKGDGVNISGMNFGLHTGTHIDAPLHFIEGGNDIASAPLDFLIGPAKVIKIEHPEVIGIKELKKKEISNSERILFSTRNSNEKWFEKEFRKDYVYLDEEGAEYLSSLNVKLVGIDYLSIAEFKKGKAVHQKLLGSNIWIIEGLYLKDVPEGEYEMYALPLKIPGSDGSPVRVVLKS
jgi:arylformamidase